MKLLDRSHGKHATEQALDTEHQELLEQLEVPDDLSGLHKVPSIGEDGHDAATESRRASPMVRWLGWVSLYVLVVAGLVTALVVFNDPADSDPVAPGVEAPDFETEGPGSPSLDAPWLAATETPWRSDFDGPGGVTQNMVPALEVEPVFIGPMPVQAPAEWSQTDGPGGTSVGMTPPPPPWSFVTEGPGSNSL